MWKKNTYFRGCKCQYFLQASGRVCQNCQDSDGFATRRESTSSRCFHCKPVWRTGRQQHVSQLWPFIICLPHTIFSHDFRFCEINLWSQNSEEKLSFWMLVLLLLLLFSCFYISFCLGLRIIYILSSKKTTDGSAFWTYTSAVRLQVSFCTLPSKPSTLDPCKPHCMCCNTEIDH